MYSCDDELMIKDYSQINLNGVPRDSVSNFRATFWLCPQKAESVVSWSARDLLHPVRIAQSFKSRPANVSVPVRLAFLR